MSWQVYSKRLLEVNGTNGWTVTYVPAGFVFIVKFVALINATATAGIASCIIHNAYIFRSSVPGNSQLSVTNLHAVAYGNEQVGINFPAASWQGHISGFLLRDPEGLGPTVFGSYALGPVGFEDLAAHAELQHPDPES